MRCARRAGDPTPNWTTAGWTAARPTGRRTCPARYTVKKQRHTLDTLLPSQVAARVVPGNSGIDNFGNSTSYSKL